MKSKVFPLFFKNPVSWEDEAGIPINVANIDGYRFGERQLEGCVFNLELQDDGQSVKVSINQGVDDYLQSIFCKFSTLAETALETFLEDDDVSIVDAATGLPYDENTKPKEKPLVVSVSTASSIFPPRHK